MTFVHLTNPMGHVVLVRADQIVSLRKPLPNEMASGTRTVIVLTNGQFQAVQEPMDAVEAKLG